MNARILWLVEFLLLVALIESSANAQDMKPPLRFGIFAGLGFPTGDFGSTSSTQAGGASTGFSFGGEFGIPLSDAVAVWTSATFAFNSLSEDFITSSSGSSSPVSGTLGTWTTIWPMTGIRYTAPISPALNFYAQGQLGLLLGSSPDVSASQSGYKYVAPSASATSFAYGFGAGLTIGKTVNVGLRYSGSQPTYEYKVTVTQSSPGFTSTYNYDAKSDFPTALFQLVIGLIF
ncbi:MAG TPA: outer membrane beta-barrel protein [Bacteroidota bacterium]|nr:outer membrane beta-barrel protein [Bacteroidota bacterium]